MGQPQQDEFHELNLFTNDSIIGWKVPTNLGASSALTVSHQYPNCIIKIINFPNISIFLLRLSVSSAASNGCAE